MGWFNDYLKEQEVPFKAIKIIDYPGFRQSTKYSCGVTEVQSALIYCFGSKYDIPESEFFKKLNISEAGGIDPESIISFLKSKGVKVESKILTQDDLKECIDSNQPVIICLQAWGEHEDYSDVYKEGHYITAIGYNDKGFIFEDPSVSARYGFIPYSDLDERWHDVSKEGKKYDHFGIIIKCHKKYDPSKMEVIEGKLMSKYLDEAGFEEKPKGWDKGSIKKYNKTFTSKMKGNVKSKGFFDKCVNKMQGKVKNPEGFCASLKDEEYGSTYWRGKDKSPGEVKKDVSQHHNIGEVKVIDYAAKREKLRSMSSKEIKQILKTNSGESLADIERKADSLLKQVDDLRRSNSDHIDDLKRAKARLDKIKVDHDNAEKVLKQGAERLQAMGINTQRDKNNIIRSRRINKKLILVTTLMGAAIATIIALKRRRDQKEKMKRKTRNENFVVENFLQSLYTDNRSQEKEWRGANIPYGDESYRPNLVRQCMTLEGNRQKINCLRKLRDQAAMNPYYQSRLDRFVDAITGIYEPTNQQGTIPGNEFKQSNVGEGLQEGAIKNWANKKFVEPFKKPSKEKNTDYPGMQSDCDKLDKVSSEIWKIRAELKKCDQIQDPKQKIVCRKKWLTAYQAPAKKQEILHKKTHGDCR